MPPRVGARASNIAAPQQCLRTSSNARQSVASQRDFSQSSGQQFHATCKNDTRLRRNMFSWLNGPGRVFREPLPGSTNYLSAYDRSGNLTRLRAGAEQEEEDKVDVSKLNAEEKAKYEQKKEAKAADDRSKLPRERGSDLRPYPLNTDFRSQSVLSEELREEIYKKIVDEKVDLSIVSALYGVDMRRVAAVARLKTIEKNWVSEGKKLATPYHDAILQMVPQTQFNRKLLEDPKKTFSHESINDLPVHPYTRTQIFYPTSESRQFTRADAAKVFSPTLLPADERIPLPELIEVEKDALNEMPREQRTARIRERTEKKMRAKEEKEAKKREWEARNVKVVSNQRWNFRFQSISVEEAGKDGRGRRGVGWRYGNPHHDREKGEIKLPTSVE
ncbi:hypothetical protein E4T50_11937 [Aureobasidium sp. EXF-12298]|nr:hypothetical protein E4T50_11937 [Aureobasidium sp. EXF-12298]KAI4755998.1 hypothetical protein E4T51_10901 [Aureobasidium sp. EXF-12344]KAI4773212.1 hypothetical protein E4T52_11805 [Aureobasidium sp. EXF-3400]